MRWRRSTGDSRFRPKKRLPRSMPISASGRISFIRRANEFTCEWGDTLCQPFEWDVLLRPVENAGAAGDKENALEREVIWWKVDYKQSDSLNQYQRGDRVRLGIAPGDIMLLKEG